ncbi:Endonuclease/exonuclease/phosphatase, partial [Mycena crocata]
MQQRNNPKISRNTRAQITVATLNIKGRGADSIRSSKHKWHDVHRMLFDNKIGILAVTETHLSAAQSIEIENDHVLGKRMRIFNSIDTEKPNSKGVAIVLNHDITNTVGVKVRRLIPGRAILAVIPWHGRSTMTILALYAPADSMTENRIFWEKLYDMWMTQDLPVPDMTLGDTNIVEDPTDRFPHRADNAAAVEALAKFKQLFEFKDGFRLTYPDVKAYTFTNSAETSHSRIDRIYVPPDLFKKCRNWLISDTAGDLTDHRLVSVVVSAPGAPFVGPGRYLIPNFLMQDKKFLTFAVEEGAKLAEPSNDGKDLQIRYKEYKEGLLAFARERAKESVGAIEQKKLKLQRERDAILNPSPEVPTDVDKTPNPVARIQTEIKALASRQRARNRLSTKIRYRNEMDNITKFSVRVHKDRKPRDTLTVLRRTDTYPIQQRTRSDDMAQLARDYHSHLQTDTSESNLANKDKAIDYVLSQMGQHTTAPDMADLEKEITEEDVTETLRSLAKGKAPGVDGIPTELWTKLHEIYEAAEKAKND